MSRRLRGDPGRLTPSWWDDRDSQYGVLKRWRVTDDGATIDGVALSAVSLDALGLRAGETIAVRIGIHPDAANVGGINIFGRGFGNYPQDVDLRIEYDIAHAEPKPAGRRRDRPVRRGIPAATGPARELAGAA